MIFCVGLPGIMENSVNCHGKVMELYYQISVGTLYVYISRMYCWWDVVLFYCRMVIIMLLC